MNTKLSGGENLGEVVSFLEPASDFNKSKVSWKGPWGQGRGRPTSETELPSSSLYLFTGNEFVQHNARQLCRVYPSALRTDSSNFHPQELWNAGCHMGEEVAGTGRKGVEDQLMGSKFSSGNRAGGCFKGALG